MILFGFLLGLGLMLGFFGSLYLYYLGMNSNQVPNPNPTQKHLGLKKPEKNISIKIS